MTQSTATPKGTKDFLPTETAKRNYIFDTIKSVFKLHGYSPIETPAMENLSTLLGKYGDEGDKLIFRILNSGDFLKKMDENDFNKPDLSKIVNKISEKGLRYDLTVPFARFVVKNQNELTLPFKRYQIQPVWRADKPQKGRYREFYQCDVDVIGSKTMINEYELIQIINSVFEKLKINAHIKINNRKILAGIFEIVGEADKFIPITVAIDKINKIGIDNVIEELNKIGLSKNAIKTLANLLDKKNNSNNNISELKNILTNNPTGKEGIEEIEKILNYLENDNLFVKVNFDFSLARGLSYYTGTIFEVIANDAEIGSICGGGRYDDLTEMFGLKDISGVGVSFGAERIYDVMEQLNLFPEYAYTSTKVIFINFGEKEENKCIQLAKELRKKGISTEIYPEQAKLKKQMQYANKKNIPYVIMIGEEELNSETLTIKNMNSGEQKTIKAEELIRFFG